MAPEQWQGDGALDDKADVYALGVVAFCALAGRAPFVADDPRALMQQHLTKQATPLSRVDEGLPATLVVLVADMLQKDAARRPTMRAVASRLRGECADAPVAAGTGRADWRAHKVPGPALWWAGALLSLLAAGFFVRC